MKKTIRVLVLLLVVCMLAGCGDSTKTYTCGELSITVPSNMKDVSSQSEFSSYTFTLDSTSLAIFGINETFAAYPVLADYDTESYAEFVVSTYNIAATVQDRSGNYHYFVYTADTEQGEFTYMAGVYKTENGFWMIQVATPTSKYSQETFFSYLDSVSFS